MNIFVTMQIQRLSHTPSDEAAFVVRQDRTPQNHNNWHYHDELEFIKIRKGSGTLFIGDCIRKFQDGDMVLIGSAIPHYWLFDDEYVLGPSPQAADICVLHFLPTFCTSGFLNLREAHFLKALYQKALKGLFFEGDQPLLDEFFSEIGSRSPLHRLTSLIDILAHVHALEKVIVLVSQNYAILNHIVDYDRMNRIMDYIRIQYRQKIQLQDIAQQAGMTENSFCRYFKQKTGKTLIQFINEIRISYACKQLKNTDQPIKEICFDSGFQNFVSFHKNFKLITQLTPNSYRQQHG